jgi:hypothetical protein
MFTRLLIAADPPRTHSMHAILGMGDAIQKTAGTPLSIGSHQTKSDCVNFVKAQTKSHFT